MIPARCWTPRRRSRRVYRAGGLLIAETLAAGLVHGHQLFFGLERNVGRSLTAIADELDIAIHVVS